MLIAIRGYYLGQRRERRPRAGLGGWIGSGVGGGTVQLLCDLKAMKQLPGQVAGAEKHSKRKPLRNGQVL